MYTHVDVPGGPRAEEYVAWQIERYRAVCAEIEAEGSPIPVKMAASSAVLRCNPGAAFDAIDPGHMLFGLTPPGPLNVDADLRPAFHSLTSRIIHAREIEREHFLDLAPFPLRNGMRFGVIPIGLRDGMAALNCGEVLVGGQRAAILGPLSLEHTRVDLSGVPEAKVGDEVVIIGRQGEAGIEPEKSSRTRASASRPRLRWRRAVRSRGSTCEASQAGSGRLRGIPEKEGRVLALRMIGRRAALSVISLLLVSLFIFVMVEALPGDAATRYLGRMATEEQKALLRTRLNLDTPAPQRYVQWLAGIVRLDFGNTMVVSRPIKGVLAPKIANTLILAGAAFLLYLPLSLIPAAIQALNRDRASAAEFPVIP